MAFFISLFSIFTGGGGSDPGKTTTPGIPGTTAPQVSRQYVYTDLAYSGTYEQKLDLYLPENVTGEVGLVLFIHGNDTWTSSNKGYYTSMAKRIQSTGYAAATINYRGVSSTVSAKNQLDDIDLALYTIKSTANKAGIRLEKMFLVGYSSGAHLAMLYAYSKASSATITPVGVWANAGASDLVTTDMYVLDVEKNAETMSKVCGYPFNALNYESAKPYLEKVSPLYYVNAGTVPTIISHAVKDKVFPYTTVQALDNKLSSCGVTHKVFPYANSDHSLNADSNTAKLAEAQFVQYASTYLSKGSATPTTSPTVPTTAPTQPGTTTPPTPSTTLPTGGTYAYNNVSYGSAGVRNVLDLRLPKKTGNVGLILFIHGGTWIFGSKEDIATTSDLEYYAGIGYAAAAMNYRYASASVHCEDIMSDITAALTKIKALAAENGITLKKAAFVGYSAGGHLATYYAYTKASSSPVTPAMVWDRSGPVDLTIDDWLKVSDDIPTVFTLLSGYKITVSNFDSNIAQLALAQLSPAYNVSSSTVPTLISHGMKDSIVPYKNAVNLDIALSAKGVKHDLVSYPNSDHGLESDPDCEAKSKALFLSYLNSYVK